jgi:protein-arginine kinase activator protein McsA
MRPFRHLSPGPWALSPPLMDSRLCERCASRRALAWVRRNGGGAQALCVHCLRTQCERDGAACAEAARFFALLAQPRERRARTVQEARLERAVCDGCGMRYAEFAAQGLAGCALCYTAFASAILPALETLNRTREDRGDAL